MIFNRQSQTKALLQNELKTNLGDRDGKRRRISQLAAAEASVAY